MPHDEIRAEIQKRVAAGTPADHPATRAAAGTASQSTVDDAARDVNQPLRALPRFEEQIGRVRA